MESRKKAVSIRISTSDLSKIKRLAMRLGVRDSDVIRFAVKTALAKLAPLHDPAIRGRSLVPVFVESGTELLRYFDLDAMRLENIINEAAEDERRVDHEDIQLIAMSGIQQPYLRWHLAAVPSAAAERNTSNGTNGWAGASSTSETQADHVGSAPSLKEYLYEKYVYRNRGAA